MYFKVKLRKNVNGKESADLVLVKTSIIEEIFSILIKDPEIGSWDYTVTDINKTLILNDFESAKCKEENYWKLELLWISPDGKDIKEEYVIKSDTIDEAVEIIKTKVPDTNKENINKITPLKLLGIIE